MKTQTLSYRDGHWDSDFPALDSDRTLVLAFGASSFADRPAPLAALRDAFPNAHVIGGSTSGEILDRRVDDDSLVVSVTRFDHTELVSAETAIASGEDSFEAGKRLAGELASEGLRAVLVISDGLNVNGSELVRGLNAVLPNEVTVSGGLAGDADRFERTWVLTSSGPRSGFVRAIGLIGDRVRVQHGSKGGWHIFGPQREVTRSNDNELFELDGKPALDLYRRYLGEHAAALPASALKFPLAIRADADDETYVVRTILGIDEDARSMTFAGNIPVGCKAQLMQANLENLIDGATQAARATARGLDEAASDVLSIAISCVGRRLMLGERAEEEVEAILDELPGSAHQVGFYSYGEISPHDETGYCDLHNQTMTLTMITEDEEG